MAWFQGPNCKKMHDESLVWDVKRLGGMDGETN